MRETFLTYDKDISSIRLHGSLDLNICPIHAPIMGPLTSQMQEVKIVNTIYKLHDKGQGPIALGHERGSGDVKSWMTLQIQ